MTDGQMTVAPLTSHNWSDLERLFGSNGACGGCWCMTWRLRHAAYERGKGDANRRALRALAEAGVQPGILLYEDAEPLGWAAVGPRADFVRLASSRILAPVDAAPVWSIPCFFVAKKRRRMGVSRLLVAAATDLAFANEAEVVEGYPHALEPGREAPGPFIWTGVLSSFSASGFREVARRSPGRPIVRIARADVKSRSEITEQLQAVDHGGGKRQVGVEGYAYDPRCRISSETT